MGPSIRVVPENPRACSHPYPEHGPESLVLTVVDGLDGVMIQVLSWCEDSPGRLWQVRSEGLGGWLVHGPGLGFVASCHAHEGSLITLLRI